MAENREWRRRARRGVWHDGWVLRGRVDVDAMLADSREPLERYLADDGSLSIPIGGTRTDRLEAVNAYTIRELVEPGR